MPYCRLKNEKSGFRVVAAQPAHQSDGHMAVLLPASELKMGQALVLAISCQAPAGEQPFHLPLWAKGCGPTATAMLALAPIALSPTATMLAPAPRPPRSPGRIYYA
ncbi:hypothetical protein PR202_gb02919 [Eleusine coracana subsp. coracana]|uniref:Uncharacterized protein n=1 Tax=Eleusine coracana subsp. coracana TaxID=191504 RepID=A0AAV5E1J0_ELECO|nr:hypothetical protein PR202_gb02919 [Eleusine coracana subsp. coracana]